MYYDKTYDAQIYTQLENGFWIPNITELAKHGSITIDI